MRGETGQNILGENPSWTDQAREHSTIHEKQELKIDDDDVYKKYKYFLIIY